MDDLFTRVVDSCIVALSDYTTEELRATADEAERRNPDSWLAPMIHEYVSVWR